MKVRLRFTEFGKIRFISHRDMARIFERAIRRGQLPIAYSEGFSPRPKLHYGLALSTGHESYAEFLDIDLRSDMDLTEIVDRLNDGLPDGLTVVGAAEVERSTTALQAAVDAVTWRYEFTGCDASALGDRVSAMIEADQIQLEIERKGKTITENVRAAIAKLDVSEETDGRTVLTALLNTRPRSIRPAELLAAIGIVPEPSRVVRIEQWITTDGEMASPLPSPVATPRAVEHLGS